MSDRAILLVEDNDNDEVLTLRALKKSNISNPVHVVRDGAEALDYLFVRGAHASRPANEMPQVILLDLKLPKIDGLGVLRAARDPRRRPHEALARDRADLIRGGAGRHPQLRPRREQQRPHAGRLRTPITSEPPRQRSRSRRAS